MDVPVDAVTADMDVPVVAMAILIRAKSKRNSRISDDLRSFAMTLHFYSAKAYQFVCDSLSLWKNTIKAIRSWYSSIHADPGFTAASFSLQGRPMWKEERTTRRYVCSDDG